MGYNEVYSKLEKYNQLHLLDFYETLSASQKKELISDIENLDLSILDTVKRQKEEKCDEEITPIDVMTIDKINKNKEKFYKIGIDAIKQKKVGAVLLAGGQGTRLGFDKPKGAFNIGINKEIFIFELLINNIMQVVKEADEWIPMYIMTSNKNYSDTVNFFNEHNFFGYNKEYIEFFIQDMSPAIDYDGKLLMEEKYKTVASPNGNGGWFTSLCKNGLMKKIKERNIQWLNVFAVDNVLQRIADPYFIGATIDSGMSSGAKVVKKASPMEGVGVVCMKNGKPSIIEYYELTDEINNVMDEKGERVYNYGVILNYLFDVNSVDEKFEKLLPIHLANRKIPCINKQGEYIKPDKPNGYKLETLVLDMLRMYDNSLIYEVDRNKEFAPVKNAVGTDSVESARKMLSLNGVQI